MKSNCILLGLTTMLIIFSFVIYSCSAPEPPTYESLVEQGLRSGERNDSLFLGYYFGMSRKDFQVSSWEMNQQGILGGLVKVEYDNRDWLEHEIKLVFFPDFHEDVIYRIPVEVHYTSWAPWNTDRSADSLVVHLASYFEEKYKQRFHEVYLPGPGKRGYFSMAGNRGISIWTKNDMWAEFEIRDYSVKPGN
ncbi:MAG: hypothetical protein LAT67_06750 [Balneolales bacterium]|nr:hypothetical protein [Balneolales bacterium]